MKKIIVIGSAVVTAMTHDRSGYHHREAHKVR